MSRHDWKARLAKTGTRRWIISTILLFLSMAAFPGQSRAAVRTFAISGTVGSSTFNGITNGTSFVGTYTVDDATGDTDGSAETGSYATGEIFLDIDGVGTVTFDQGPTTSVRDNFPALFAMEQDLLQISADEGSRSLSFTNSIGSAVLAFLTETAPSPTTLTSDSLVAALAVDFADWEDGGAIAFTVEDAGDASCEALATSCGVRLDIASAAEGFPLTVVKTGTGNGTVVSTPAGIDCGATCSAPLMGMVTLEATAAPGSVFTGFTGCDSVMGTTCSVLVDGPITVEADFELEAQGPTEAIPTLSEWGLILMGLLLAAAGTWAMAGRFA